MTIFSVKRQKQIFKSVEIDTRQPPYVFKCQLYDLTGVPPERQKIMVKGGLLKGDADWSTVGVKQGQKLMMIGTADEIVKAPEKGPVFMEDLEEEEQVISLGHSAGLFNLGNTCYMNSTVQCLHSVPELKSALFKHSHSGRSNDLDQTSHMLTVATRDLFNELDKSVKPVAPMQFWMVLLIKHPRFSRSHNGVFMQQDTEECWTQLLYTLSQSLRSPGSSANVDTVKDLFGTKIASRIHCQESGEESFETESIYSLKCHISQEVNHLHEGLKHGLKSELEKASPALGHSAIYFKESQINDLPSQLKYHVAFLSLMWMPFYVLIFHNFHVSIHLFEEKIVLDYSVCAFFWKRESSQKDKILRKVDYPLELDVYDLCPRQLLRDDEGKKLGSKANEKSSGSKDGDVKMTDAEGSSNAGGESSATTSQEAVPSDKETSLTGIYDLVAVLTHKGRSADSGHYVAWVKQENGKWIEFDDDNHIPQQEEDIVKLSGGGNLDLTLIKS
ncbi:hypothetical protein E1A91_A10G067700v1 [Gossypium mustelinum]|uniref:Ubiquitin carboxyl-terminal hydrolase n=1 Tax=Gossypium mustelinum TaxID=34275 RepID=A0A5D2XIZ1_GOSMU|nr:hypothetical protein E1A91_A10G067700v1 [Gossypium mustelinum]